MTDDPNRVRPTQPIPHTDPDGSPVKNPTEARGGALAGRMRWVLVLGIAAVALAFLFAILGTRP